MVATNDDILNALNQLIALNTPKSETITPSLSITHNGVIVELDKETGLYKPKKSVELV